MDLKIETFSPKLAELQELSLKYLSLEIKGVEDKEGYLAVDNARKNLKKVRVDLQKTGKEMRDEANKFAKAVIEKEKELVAIIEPVEISLKEMQEKIDNEKEMIKRADLLPERKDRLLKVGVEISDSFILLMDDVKFQTFLNDKTSEYLAEQQRKIDEENARQAEAKKIEEAREKARLEAEENAKRELALAKQKAIYEQEEAVRKANAEKQEALKKAEAEKQAIIDENNRKEQARLAEETRIKKEQEDKANAEKQAQEKLEKQKKYKQFLMDNKYNQDTDLIDNKENKVIIYRKIAEFIK